MAIMHDTLETTLKTALAVAGFLLLMYIVWENDK
jgi:hypothetical protein